MRTAYLFFVIVFSFSLEATCAKTIFIPRSLTHNGVLELALNNYHYYHNALDYEHQVTAGLYFAPFYGRSNNASAIAQFFLPPRTAQLHIRENGLGNIGSAWIGISCGQENPFESTVCIRPERKVAGLYTNLMLPLPSFADNMWGSIAFAVVHADHNVHAQETIQNSCDNQSSLQAFNNSDWKAGKISCEGQTNTAVDDIQFKLGYNWFWDDENHFGLYGMASAPTGKRNNTEFVFAPIVGSHHGSFGFGFNLDVGCWVGDEKYFNLMADGHYRYAFSQKEKRSFDLLRNGPWSRYLAVVTQEQTDQPRPGINLFTQEVTTRPNSRIQFWSALHYEWCKFNMEIGYNYWWRNSETICNLHFDNHVGIWDVVADPQVNAVSASKAHISQAAFGTNQAPSDSVFTQVQVRDFDLCSAEHPATASHTYYLALSYNGEIDNCPGLMGIGISYELPRNNAALEQWMVWGKLGFVF